MRPTRPTRTLLQWQMHFVHLFTRPSPCSVFPFILQPTLLREALRVGFLAGLSISLVTPFPQSDRPAAEHLEHFTSI